MPVKLEICVDTLDGLDVAGASGADRIELCGALALGGLTPPPGMLLAAAAAPCPVLAMIRPRAGDFVYTPAEETAMLRDIDAAAAAGLSGIVIGALTRHDRLDTARLDRLLRHARQAGLGEATLHRAFDLVDAPEAALDEAIGLGFTRILTSGGAPTALEGATRIARHVAQAAGRIAILAGAGISALTVAPLVAAAGVCEVHASCRAPVAQAPDRFGFGTDQPRTSPDRIAALRAALADLP